MRKFTYFYSLLLTALFLLPWSGNAWAYDPLTVADGTYTNGNVPVVLSYTDTEGTKSQIIYLKDDLQAMKGKDITSLAFYASKALNWNGGSTTTIPQFTIKIKEISASTTTLSAFETTELDEVYTGQPAKGSTTLYMEFDNAFTYSGNGNLLIDFEVTGAGGYMLSTNFYGVSTTLGSSYYYRSSTYKGQQGFRPKATFTYVDSSPCKKPKNIQFTDLKSTSVAFSWDKGGEETAWQYLCLPTATAITDSHWESASSTTSQSASISGLTASSSYVFYVRSDCSSDGQSIVVQKAFKTPCDGETLPWSCGFEASEGYSNSTWSSTSAAPACWDMLNANSGYPYIQVYSRYHHDGTQSLDFTSGKDKSCYIALPAFASPTNILKISFWYRNEGTNSSNGQLSVGYMTDVTDETTYVEVSSCTRTTTVTQKQNILFTGAPSFARIVFRYSGTANDYYAAIDDILVEATTDCSAPATPTYSDLTGNSVTVSWTANAGVTDYKYINVDRTANPTYVLDWENDATEISATSVDLSGLTDGHTYNFYVMCACGTEASDACEYTPLSCPNVTGITCSSLTYQSFSVSWDAAMGVSKYNLRYKYKYGVDDWTEVNDIEALTYTISFGGGAITGPTFTIELQSACGGSWTSIDYAPVIPKPAEVTASSVKDVTAHLSWSAVEDATKYQYCCVPAGEDPVWPSTFTTGTSADLSGLTVNTNYTAYVRARFEGIGASAVSAPTSVNFTTETVAPAFDPMIEAPEVGTTTASVMMAPYTGSATQYQYVCMVSTATPNWASASLVSSGVSKIDLSDLQPGTTYKLYVRAYYSENVWSNSISKEFPTNCDVKAIGWSESFSSTTPSCWNTYYTYWSSSSYQWKPSTDYAKSASYSMQVYSYQYSSSNIANLETPSIAITEKANLTFYYLCTYAVPFSVIMKVNGKETVLASYNADKSSWGTTPTTIAIPDTCVGKTLSIIFRATGAGTSYKRKLYIDDVAINYAPVTAPTSLAAEAGNTSATITWAHEENGPFDLRYRAVGAEDWIPVNSIAAKSHALTGLTNGTEYEVQVRANISANRISDWTASQNFTPASCPAVTGVTLDNKLYNSVTVNWTAEGATECDVRYSTDGGSSWTSAATNVSATSQAVAVAVGNSYTFAVKPSCSADGWVAAGETYAPAYGVPGEPSVTDITASAANASWTDALYGPTGYEYVLMPGETAANWTGAQDATSPLALSDLTDGTNYTLYVRAQYGENRGEASSKNFTTATIAPAFTSADPATTQTTATIALEAYAGSAAKFQYICLPASTTLNDSHWLSASLVDKTTSIELTGLDAGSSYKLYVRAYYSSTLQSDVVNKPFQTACGAKAIGWSENFDAAAELPACWSSTSFGSGNNKWNIDNFYESKSSWNSARFNAYKNSGSSSADLITPDIALTEPAQLKFFYLKNSSDVVAQVLIRIAGEEDEVIWTATNKSSWATKADSIDLRAYTGNTVKLIFRAYGSTSGTTRYFYLDNVSVDFKFCEKPTVVNAVAGDASATISWTDDVEAGPWDVRYRAYNAEPAASWTTVSSATKEKAISGLTNGTEYEVQVRTHCSENRISAWTESVNFTPVACAAVSEVTFGDKTYNSVVVNWTASAAGTFELQYKAGEGDWTTASNTISELTYTLNDLTPGTAYSVRVKSLCAEEWFTAAETFTPVYTAPANAAIVDATDATASASWAAVTDAPNGYKYIVVAAGETPNWDEATATNELTASLTGLAALSDYDFYVAAVYGDHVEAATPVNFQTIAVAPTDLTQGTTTTNSIAFSWSYAGAASQFQWKSSKAGSNWSEPISEQTATETGLSAGTSYTIYVRAYYSATVQSAELSETFGTGCAVVSLPFSQDFEDGVSPLCWSTTPDGYYDYAGNQGWKVTTDNDGNYVMRYTSGSALVTPALTLPQINLTATPAVLSFKVMNNYSNKTVAGNVTVSAEGVADHVTALTTSNSLTEQRIDLSDFAGKVITIQFQASGNNNGGRIDLDDIRILEQLTLADTEDNTATLSANLNKTVDVTIGRTIFCDGDYNTICLPFDLPDLAGTPLAGATVKKFKYAVIDSEELQVRVIDSEEGIKAGVPYLLKMTAENLVSPLFKNVTITASAAQTIGQSEPVAFVGTFAPVPFEKGNENTLFVHTNNNLTWSGKENTSLKAFRAYFLRSSSLSAAPLKPGMRARIVEHVDNATGVENVQGEGQAIKLLENDHVVIIRNGVKYSIQGQKIQ